MGIEPSKEKLEEWRKEKRSKQEIFSEIGEVQRGIENFKREDALDSITSTKPTIRKLIVVDNIEKYRIKWDAPSFPHKFIDYAPQDPAYSGVNFKGESDFARPKIVMKRVCNKIIISIKK